MQQLFPLTEEIWLDWLADEENRARETSDPEDIQRLYELAADDYLSVPLWEAHLR